MRGMAPRATASILHWHGLPPREASRSQPAATLDDPPLSLLHIRQVDVLGQT